MSCHIFHLSNTLFLLYLLSQFLSILLSSRISLKSCVRQWTLIRIPIISPKEFLTLFFLEFISDLGKNRGQFSVFILPDLLKALETTDNALPMSTFLHFISLWTVTTVMKLRHLLLGKKVMTNLDSVLCQQRPV